MTGWLHADGSPGGLPARRTRVNGIRQLRALLIFGSAMLTLLPGSALAFQMNTLSGDRVQLEQYVGGGLWTLVQFWNLDCITCEQQKPMLDSFHRAHRNEAARVIGVAMDGPEKIDAIQARLARGVTSFEHLVAYPDVFARQFLEATGEPFRVSPTYWLFDPSGNPVGVHVGPVSLDALEQVMTGKP